jgi:polysaccharide biosynthesis/export protein
MLSYTILLTTSCNSAKNLKYFSNLSDTQQVLHLPPMQHPEMTIMPDDILDIRFFGANEATVALFNINGNSVAKSDGYMVDGKGEIEFPFIGTVKVAGLTRDSLKTTLTALASKYLKDVMVSVRFVNFRFTVLGEVKNPGIFLLQNEKVTVLEALGLAGDMTQYARRSNVKIIRDSSGNREIGTIDFNDKAVFSSRYYYLYRNDVVYVEPEKNKGKVENALRFTSILATVASLVAVSLTFFK